MITAGIIICLLTCALEKVVPIFWSVAWVYVPGAVGLVLVVHGMLSALYAI